MNPSMQVDFFDAIATGKGGPTMGPLAFLTGLGAGGGAALSGGIQAGTSLLGGILDQAIFQPQQRRAQGRQAAQMDPYIQALASLGQQIGAQGQAIAGGGDYGGLRGQAARELGAASQALNAQLAQRGIYSSGAAIGQQRQLAGDVYSQLAQAINADQLQRQQIGLGALGQQAMLSGQAAQMVGAQPGYQYFDQSTGRTRGK